MKKETTISFVTPNYNDSKTIERQIKSIADQDLKGVEHIIVDDASTDGSKKLLQGLEKKYKHLRVLYLKKNTGACGARNVGAEVAKGKYLSFLPADAKLYPGMARIWYEKLEEFPEYDFLYGGYRFTDEKYNPIFDYTSDEFDPYFLKVNNYIDGSFPIKKELFDKMGGWDESIKSLQDWEFWLNAVINHKAKGMFVRDIFFETTMPHAGGLSDDSHKNWIARTDTIKKKHGITNKKICVTGDGAQFHAKNVAKLLGADYLPSTMLGGKPHKYEMIYTIGFFGNVSQGLWNTNALRVLHWIGSDILSLKEFGKTLPSMNEQQKKEVKDRQQMVFNWLDNNIDIHLCEFEETQKELEEMGIKSRVVPFPPERMFEPMDLPKKFSVAVYMPYQNKAFYQPDLIYDVAAKMKSVDFHLFGDVTMFGEKGNIFHHGVVSGDQKNKLIQDTSAILRLTPHDGLPLSVIEWITAGRNAATTVSMEHSTKVKMKKVDIVRVLKELKTKSVNKKGSEYYRKICDPKLFKETIEQLGNVDIKKWWELLTPVWPKMESGQETTEDIGNLIKEVKATSAKSVIDLGCGTGRFADILGIDKYMGIDFSKDLIKAARSNHPDKDFMVADIKEYAEKFSGEKFDLAFTFASLLHIKPHEFEDYMEAIGKIAKKAIFIEPIRDAVNNGRERFLHPEIIRMQKDNPEFVFNIKHTWVNDYMSLDIEKVIQMSNNRNLFVVNL